MIRVCFVCLGNICRSPMAEFMMKEEVRKRGLSAFYQISSRATSYEEEGNDMYPQAKNMLEDEHIPYTRHYATRLEKKDYHLFDVFYCMEKRNLDRTVSIFEGDPDGKVCLLLNRDISDPWYTGDFSSTFCDLEEGISNLLKK